MYVHVPHIYRYSGGFCVVKISKSLCVNYVFVYMEVYGGLVPLLLKHTEVTA